MLKLALVAVLAAGGAIFYFVLARSPREDFELVLVAALAWGLSLSLFLSYLNEWRQKKFER
jgi:hypothetical protein